jgi:hypothetical protein
MRKVSLIIWGCVMVNIGQVNLANAQVAADYQQCGADAYNQDENQNTVFPTNCPNYNVTADAMSVPVGQIQYSSGRCSGTCQYTWLSFPCSWIPANFANTVTCL